MEKEVKSLAFYAIKGFIFSCVCGFIIMMIMNLSDHYNEVKKNERDSTYKVKYDSLKVLYNEAVQINDFYSESEINRAKKLYPNIFWETDVAKLTVKH